MGQFSGEYKAYQMPRKAHEKKEVVSVWFTAFNVVLNSKLLFLIDENENILPVVPDKENLRCQHKSS